MAEFNDTAQFCMHFHVGCHFPRLLTVKSKRIMDYKQEGLNFSAIPQTSTSDAVGQNIKILGIISKQNFK